MPRTDRATNAVPFPIIRQTESKDNWMRQPTATTDSLEEQAAVDQFASLRKAK